MKLRSLTNYLVLSCAALIVAACANQREPAKQAIDNINSVMAAASPDAAKYVPDQLAQVKSKLAQLNASFDKKDYAAVVAGAPTVLTEAQGLSSAAAAKKAEAMKALNAEWATLEAAVPPLISAVKTRVESLSKSKRAPKGIDLAAAKSGLDTATAQWDKAEVAFKSTDVKTAVTAGNEARAKIEAASTGLKSKLPERK
jgi:hypothetical protein